MSGKNLCRGKINMKRLQYILEPNETSKRTLRRMQTNMVPSKCEQWLTVAPFATMKVINLRL